MTPRLILALLVFCLFELTLPDALAQERLVGP
jgi:hypothetical protein